MLLLGAAGAYSCQNQRGLPEEALERANQTESPETAASELRHSDPFELISAAIEGDSMRIVVQYGGGCAEHAFELVASGPALRSMPPKQGLELIHEANGDACRALIREELMFGLQQFQASPRGVTVLMLQSEKLPYSYD